MKKEKFDIQGMTCSSCVSHVEKAVCKLEGVKKVNVNLITNDMVVEYNDEKLSDNIIISAVTDAGYGASKSNNEENTISFEKFENLNKKIKNEDVISSMRKRLIISICFLIPLMLVSMHHMIFSLLGIQIPNFINNILHGNENALKYALLQLVLLIPIIYVNKNYFLVGFKRLFKRSPNMDSLIAIGSSASILYGLFAIYKISYGLIYNVSEIVSKYSMDLYFESAGTILTLVTVGKYLETKSKGKTGDAISKLINLAPKTAIVIKENKEIEMPVEKIVAKDIILIKPGTSIPVDGVVIEGSSSIDQASITGESIPVQKSVGDSVISGTINKNGSFKMKAERVGENTTLSQIIKLVEEASNSKAPISRLADIVAGFFVPIVILIAIIATLIWLYAGQSFEFALSIGIAVLVISCPCALGLATPVAIMVGTGKAAENGILVKDAESLENLHSIQTLVLDKTGTITKGIPKVTDIITNQDIIMDGNIGNGKIKFVGNKKNKLNLEHKLLKIAGSLEKNSEHPLADAIIQKVNEENIDLDVVNDFVNVSGRGIKGKIDGEKYFGGNLAFMRENGINIEYYKNKSEELTNEGKTLLYFANTKEIIGLIAVSDTIKETSKNAIKHLKNRNIDVIMITGDNQNAAKAIANQVGIDEVIADVMPQDKEKEVQKLQSSGKKVAFVGDGINDSPALTKADIGIAIGSGTDIAIESADIVLIKDDLADVVTAIDLSKKTINNIKLSLFWAFFYNIIGIPIAAGVLYPNFGIKLSPMIGAAAMSLSSVCVVTNALRLRKFKSNKKTYIEDLLEEGKFEIEKSNLEEKVNTSMTKESYNTKNNEGDLLMKTILIEGMICEHCKNHVEKALNSIEGINKVQVSLENKNAIVESSIEIDNEKIKEVIKEAGYEVKNII